MKTLLLVLALGSPAFAQQPGFPDAPTRARMVKELAAEMERLDGEALFVRRNRPHTFQQIAERLSGQAASAEDWAALLRVFNRLDKAYPNLHASFAVGNWRENGKLKRQPKARFRSSWLGPREVEYRIWQVDEDFSGALPGDRLLAINAKPVKEVGDEYFEFCKMPLREQCDAELPAFLELDGKPLQYTLERGGKIFKIDVPVVEVPRQKREYLPCETDKSIYEGFTLAYSGRFACFFTKNDDPSTILLRIRSFQYIRAENHPINSVRKEIDAFWPWWQERAPRTSHLLIDVADNGGGNAPIPYYEVFFPKPFQEQYVTFRKMPEMLNERLRRSVFWTEEAQEIWFQNMLKDGTWERTAEGGFLTPVPMFCPSHKRDCRDGLFSVRDHGFRGRVSLVVNPNCVSSCDGFVYAFHEEVNARVVGQPQAADSAYSRLAINVWPDPQKGFRLEVGPIYDENSENALFTQTIAYTRSVTADGTVVSGIPVPVDRFVPSLYNQTNEEWRNAAVKAAVER